MFAGEDFCGEMDLARSTIFSVSTVICSGDCAT